MAVPQIHMIALKDHLSNDGRRLRGDPTGEDGAPYILHSEMEAAQHVQLGLGKRVSPAAKEGAEEAEEPALDAPWTLGVPPEQYLAKWPQGPNAAQARAILEKKAAEQKPAPQAQPATGPRPIS
jgi:hypothetical protein